MSNTTPTLAAPVLNMRDRFIRYVEGDGTETAGNTAGTGTEGAAAAQTAATTATTQTATETAGTTQTSAQAPANPWDDPAAARAEIEKLRRENGAERVNAKTQAAEEARNELLQKLGLTKDGEKTPDPDALAKDLTTAREQARQHAVDLAVYKAAAANQANPDALLDSASFLAKVRTLDPNGADFTTQVTDAIKTAVTTNQALKAVRATGASGVELTGGSGEQGQITEAQLARMTPDQIVDAQTKGLLKNLLG